MSNRSVAVVGAGIFGLLAAIRLAEEGFRVSVFDLNTTPMRGASKNNQNRLHLGFHYPRSPETAQQCIEGFDRFVKMYPECISTDFQNCYAIASQGSLTSELDYLNFCNSMGLNYEILSPNHSDIQVRNVDLVIATAEAVYDAKALSKNILSRMAKLDVDVNLGVEVKTLNRKGSEIELSTSEGGDHHFDAVVNATYANQNYFDAMIGHALPERQFEYTAIPIISLFGKRAGMTIMDGGFMTILPFGLSDQLLLYHVDHSVVDVHIGDLMPASWLGSDSTPFSKIDKAKLFEEFKRSCGHFVPDIGHAKLQGWLHGPRMVLSRMERTDARPSVVRTLEANYVSVFSGKTDHATLTAEEIVTHFLKL